MTTKDSNINKTKNYQEDHQKEDDLTEITREEKEYQRVTNLKEEEHTGRQPCMKMTRQEESLT